MPSLRRRMPTPGHLTMRTYVRLGWGPMLPVRPDFQELKARFHAAAGAPRAGREALFSTAIPAIDAVLGGGIPFGSLVTLEGARKRRLPQRRRRTARAGDGSRARGDNRQRRALSARARGCRGAPRSTADRAGQHAATDRPGRGSALALADGTGRGHGSHITACHRVGTPCKPRASSWGGARGASVARERRALCGRNIGIVMQSAARRYEGHTGALGRF